MMIEKRFILAEDSNGLYSIFDTEDKEDNPLIYGAEFGTEKIVDLLNELNDERMMYKTTIDKRIVELEDENEQLKQQLLYDGDDVCGICKHEYLTPSRDYFIGRCEKGHEECSKEDIKYCEDFKLKEADDE